MRKAKKYSELTDNERKYRNAWNTEYARRFDFIKIKASKEDGALFRKAAADAGMSVNAWISSVLLEEISK